MFIPMGSVKNYVKALDLKKKWENNKNDLAKMMPTLYGTQQTGSANNSESDTYTLQFIQMRLNAGKKLSSGEMDYLRRKHPELYSKALAIKQEREEYERQLRLCKTKEEARLLKMGKISQFGGGTRPGESGGSSSGADIQMRVMAINDEHIAFTATKRYKSLPGDHREMRERKKNGSYRAPAPAAGKPADSVLYYDTRAKTHILGKPDSTSPFLETSGKKRPNTNLSGKGR